jgi:hypothetical protein
MGQVSLSTFYRTGAAKPILLMADGEKSEQTDATGDNFYMEGSPF